MSVRKRILGGFTASEACRVTWRMLRIGRFHPPWTLSAMWYRFSEIQCATWMEVCSNTLDRFVAWQVTGDDNEAWS